MASKNSLYIYCILTFTKSLGLISSEKSIYLMRFHQELSKLCPFRLRIIYSVESILTNIELDPICSTLSIDKQKWISTEKKINKMLVLIFLQFSGVLENPYLTKNPKIRAQVWSGLDHIRIQGFPVRVLKMFGF